MTRSARRRLDQLLVERGLAATRSRAQALLLAGRVRVGAGDGARRDLKPGDLVDPGVTVEVTATEPYVSRGGEKLASALAAFAVDPRERICLDVGASTGGFTDALLKGGAARVYAVDVGRGQLAEPLRRDRRVILMERTNARSLGRGVLPEQVELAVIDVSFISLRLVLGPVAACFGRGGGPLIALVKPQFEAGRGQVPGGVVRDPTVHRAVLELVARHALAIGLELRGASVSPLVGPAGNREFFLQLGVPPSGDDERAMVVEGAELTLPAGWAARFDELTHE